MNSVKVVNLKDGYTIPEKPIVNNTDRLQAFYYPRSRLNLINLYLIKTKCTGKSCDALNMAQNNVKCACFGAVAREAAVTLILELQVIPQAPSQPFKVTNHTSKKLTRFFVKDRFIPTEVSINDIINNRHAWVMFRDSIINILTYYNNGPGMNVNGWVRRGKVKDKAKEGEQPTRFGAEGEKIESALLIHHITNIEPSRVMEGDIAVDEDAVENMRFNFRDW